MGKITAQQSDSKGGCEWRYEREKVCEKVRRSSKVRLRRGKSEK